MICPRCRGDRTIPCHCLGFPPPRPTKAEYRGVFFRSYDAYHLVRNIELLILRACTQDELEVLSRISYRQLETLELWMTKNESLKHFYSRNL